MTAIRPALVLLGLVCAAPRAALAAPPPPGGTETTATPEVDGIESLPPPRDTLGGHVQVAATALLAVPFASIDSDTNFGDRAAAGFGAGADLGLGVSRSVAVGVYGQYLAYGEPDACTTCDPSTLGFGAFVRYHLVQGVRFDPWASIGAGYRTFDTGETRYSGIEWLRLSVGGDWYALSQVGFGPFLELNFGSFLDTPAGTDPAVYATFAAGIRVALDFPGK